MTFRVQIRDPDTKRWNGLCDLKDRDLAEIALRKWADYLLEHDNRVAEMRIIKLDR